MKNWFKRLYVIWWLIYAANINVALDFFSTLRHTKGMSFRRPTYLNRYDKIYVSLCFGITEFIFFALAAGAYTLAAFMLVNLLLQLSNGLGRQSKQILRRVSWSLFSGDQVRAKLVTFTDGGDVVNSILEKFVWLNENVPLENWTAFDEEGWLQRLQYLELAGTSTSIRSLAEHTVIHILFKYKKDAMMFKLTFGEDSV